MNKLLHFNFYKFFISILVFLYPLSSFAASEAVNALLGKIAKYILNPIIILGFTVATIYFFYGVADMIWGSDSSKIDEKKKNVLYGVIGLVVMFSVYGILNFVLKAFDIPCGSLFFCGKN